SGCPLTTSQGMMVGRYEMVASDGRRLMVEIPAFSLDMPDSRRVMH
ncbi:MAG: Co2+/Mg2+ efflux protein ApaG, partial [Methylobacterium sp.]|nr:Co2+/Mg2+ efflux protein ApaG [Methylobacterium sp.]